MAPKKRIFGVLWLLGSIWAAGCDGGPVHADGVDLTGRPWHVKEGFSPRDAKGFPTADAVSATPPLYPERIFAGSSTTLEVRKAKHYAVRIDFSLSDPSPHGAWGLRLASIGQAWEVYVNGKHVAGDIELTENGALASRQRRGDFIIPIAAGAVRQGENVIVIHLAGDPSPTPVTPNFALGFFLPGPYFIAPYRTMAEPGSVRVDASLLSIFLFVGLFSLGITLYRPKERLVTGAFGVTALGLFCFLATRDPLLLNPAADTSPLYRASFIGGIVGTAAAVIFVHVFTYEDKPFRLYEKAYLALSGFLGLWFLAAPFPTLFSGALLWQVVTLFAMGTLLGGVAVEAARENTRARILIPVIVLPMSAVLWDIVNSITDWSSVRLAEYGFLLLVVGVGVLSMTAYLRTFRNEADLRAIMQQNQRRMESLNQAAIEAFCLREGNSIIQANPAFLNLFGISAEKVAGMPFTHLFVTGHRERILPALETDNTPIEARAEKRNGETFAAEFVSRTYDLGRRSVKVTAVRDITVRQRQAEKLKERNNELQALTDKMVERELAMIELKKQIDALNR